MKPILTIFLIFGCQLVAAEESVNVEGSFLSIEPQVFSTKERTSTLPVSKYKENGHDINIATNPDDIIWGDRQNHCSFTFKDPVEWKTPDIKNVHNLSLLVVARYKDSSSVNSITEVGPEYDDVLQSYTNSMSFDASISADQFPLKEGTINIEQPIANNEYWSVQRDLKYQGDTLIYNQELINKETPNFKVCETIHVKVDPNLRAMNSAQATRSAKIPKNKPCDKTARNQVFICDYLGY